MCDWSSLTQSTDVGMAASLSNDLSKDCVFETGDQSLTVPSLEADNSCCREVL